MSMDWKPRVRPGLRWESLLLTPEEGFLLSRVDGATSVSALRQLTGMSAARVEELLGRLEQHGAIEPGPGRTALHAAPETTIEEVTPRGRRHDLEDVGADDLDDLEDGDAEIIRRAMAELQLDPSLLGDDTDEGAAIDDDEPAATVPRLMRPEAPPADPDDEPVTRVEPAVDVDEDAPDAVDDDRDDEKADGEGEGGEEHAAVEEGNHRKLFETQLHGLPREERERLARTAEGPTLMALCFDPVPHVISGLMENPQVGYPHARLIARYHRTPQGLEAIFGKRPELARDAQVQRWMLANPMLADTHLKRILSPKPLAQVYTWSLSRDLPEHNRGKVRTLFRHKWGTADGEERANLVWSCEGRCLQFLTGLQLDSKATTLLCARSIHSVMLVQSLCRFTATPPPLLAHLARQAVVRRQPNLRTMIMQHPNCPADLKRSLRMPSS
jgi:DNA-binding MarR family transcriptional regulator